MSLQYKAYLYEDRVNRPKEIRRFPVDEGVSSSYEYLRRKVASVFPNLDDNFALQWRDIDGDLIWFNSDEELMQALAQLNDGIFRLYIKQNPSNPDNDEPRGPCGPRRCGPRTNWPGAWGGFGAWAPPPFHQFSSEFQNQCPFYQQQQQTCGRQSTGSKQKDSHSEKPTTSTAGEQPSTGAHSQNPGESYLQHVGNAVADFLQPFGIDVDINVEHKGNMSSCPGTKKQQKSSDTTEQTTTSSDPRETQQGSPSKNAEEADWTFLKKDGEKSDEEAQGGTGESSMETDDGTKLKEALARLTDMGFNDNGGWLTNLLTASEYDIVRVLEAMQPARDPNA